MTSTAWDTHRRRARALREVVDRIERSGSAHLPAVPDAFADEADVLVALHGLWSRRLGTRVDMALELDDRAPEECVAAAWREVARQMPTVRRVLDRYQDHPALASSEQHEHRLLAIAAGRATVEDPMWFSASEGKEYVESFRGVRRQTSSPAGGWRQRMRDVLSPSGAG